MYFYFLVLLPHSYTILVYFYFLDLVWWYVKHEERREHIIIIIYNIIFQFSCPNSAAPFVSTKYRRKKNCLHWHETWLILNDRALITYIIYCSKEWMTIFGWWTVVTNNSYFSYMMDINFKIVPGIEFLLVKNSSAISV
jgi:hypothetical protein